MSDRKMIYLDDAIDAVAEGLKRTFVEYRDVAEKMLNKLPSAQPEIIRCKDCKYSVMTVQGDCKYCKYFMEEFDITDAVYISGDDFCSMAERREDATD